MVLGDGTGSRLFWNIYQQGLAETAAASLSAFDHTGMLATLISTTPEHAPAVLELAQAELKGLEEDGVREDELRRAKDKLISRTVLDGDSAYSRMQALAYTWVAEGRVRSIEDEMAVIEATAYFAQAAKEAAVSAVVNMSQVSARRAAKSHAAFNHWVAERVFDWSGLAVTHLQPTFFAEWFLSYAQSIKDGLVQLPFGESKHAPIAAEDQARLIASILEHPAAHSGKTYQLFGPQEYTYPEAFALSAQIVGHPITYERIPYEVFREQWSKRRSPFFGQHLFEVAQDHAEGVFSGTDEVIERITGHKPMSLEECIRKHRRAFE